MNNTITLMRYAEAGADMRDWYAEARGELRKLCDAEGWKFDVFCDVLAIFSPRVSVVRNYRFAVHYMRTGYFLPDVMRSTRAAIRHYENTGEIRGRKTSAFARNLMGDETALVLDVWMARALGVEQAVVTRLDNMAAAYRRVKGIADRKGWTIAQTQAAIWCGVCRHHGVRPGHFARAIEADSQIGFDF